MLPDISLILFLFLSLFIPSYLVGPLMQRTANILRRTRHAPYTTMTDTKGAQPPANMADGKEKEQKPASSQSSSGPSTNQPGGNATLAADDGHPDRPAGRGPGAEALRRAYAKYGINPTISNPTADTRVDDTPTTKNTPPNKGTKRD